MDTHLTKPHPDKMQAYIRNTPAGMAHWSGTGPPDTTCKTCVNAIFHGYYAKSNKAGVLKPISCAKYKSVMEDAPRYDANKASCIFFEPGGSPPVKGK